MLDDLPMCASSSRWNTTISSMRFRNSGLKWLRTTAMTVCSSAPPPRLRRHDEHRVREVDGAALAVGEAAVVEHLEQHVEHVGVRLLDLVEQHDRVRAAAHRLGELPALLVADVARRRADEARHVVLLLVLRHVDADHRPLVVEEEVGERAGELRLPDARRAEEQERADRAVRDRRDPARERRIAFATARDGLVLADDARRGARPPCARASPSRPP